MLAIERRNQIRLQLIEKKSVSVTEIANLFDVTEETIRRDLKVMEEEGLLTRTYGGAYIKENVLSEEEVKFRETAYLDSKELIASSCLNIIQSGDTLFLDSSTTAAVLASKLKNLKLTVVTNSLMVVDQVKEMDNIHLICIGGTYSSRSKSFNGSMTLKALKGYFVDKAFISCRSLSMEHGITDSNEENAQVRQLIVKSSDKTYLIADKTKIGKTSFVQICDFEDITGLISDYSFSPDWKHFLLKKNISLYECR
ncbi:DeoR/GlpR family DNA-binding transcription regulator [Lachnospiraceae bacterium C1.1]|nr:DeoR/GlpR family DNA-binding transcription regulator [Lachnospiraceae bacterium C1.1]